MDAERFARDLSAFSEDDRRAIEAVERELATLLAVEPPYDSVARIHARIRQEERRGSRWSMRWAAAAAAVLAATVATGLITARRSERVEQPRVVHRVEPTARQGPAPAALPPAGVARSVLLPRRVPALSRRGSAAQVDVEVLVPPDQRVAIARVLEMGRSGLLDARALSPGAASATNEESAVPVTPIVVQGLQVPLIELAGGAIEVGHQRN